jgi:tetratricopeptide (TPR) repeat protein
MQSTEHVCREILSLDANHASSLHFLADRALQAGNFGDAEAHLQALLAASPGDLQLRSQLGQALYRQGKLQQALVCYIDCWRINPRNKLIYLTIGCLHLELGNLDKAAQVFSLGEAVEVNLLSLWRGQDVNPAVAGMSRKARDAMCRHHTDLHLRAVDGLDDAANIVRIRNAVWPLLDAREVNYDHPLHQAQVFHIQYSESPAFFERETFSWSEQLEAQFPAIRAEILAGLDVPQDGRPYLGDGHHLEGEQWQPLVNKMNWASVHLYSRGIANRDVVDKFPLTLAALESLPLATPSGNPAEVFISVLAPHTRIPEHFGVSSAILTAHLPIEVPPGCGLKVHEETRAPEEGKLMVFDDTWQHCAWNDSDQQRVVLIFELWHPELTAPDKVAIANSFQARERWLRQRSVD